ncbi:MAG: electron transport complex subunit RsxG [Ectothiorhodospiraceae bacterium]|nr:electron transport complex subunit RsxG [Ectothiorhodospiraceae bacterium]
MLMAGALLTVIALLGVGVVAYTYQGTLDRIEDNRRLALLKELQAVVPADRYDNAPERDTIAIPGSARLGTGGTATAYRARLEDEPVAVILPVVASDGYAGPIHLLVGIYTDGTLAGVRVTAHQETPGLGDGIETRRGDWIFQFADRSLENPEPEHWALRRNGGEFDQLTGATVTSRAVVKAVRNALLYFQEHQETLFAHTATLDEAAAQAVAEDDEGEDENGDSGNNGD